MDLAGQLVQHIHENQVIGRNNLHEFDTRDWSGVYEFYSLFLVRPLVCLRVQQVIFKLFTSEFLIEIFIIICHRVLRY